MPGPFFDAAERARFAGQRQSALAARDFTWLVATFRRAAAQVEVTGPAAALDAVRDARFGL